MVTQVYMPFCYLATSSFLLPLPQPLTPRVEPIKRVLDLFFSQPKGVVRGKAHLWKNVLELEKALECYVVSSNQKGT